MVSPSSSPTDAPSVQPSAPTDAPSSSPTAAAPSVESPLQELLVTDSEMTLAGIILPLSINSEMALEQIAGDTIAYTVKKILGRNQIQSLVVEVSYI